MNANVHMILQGKGGVGKSMISSVLAQYKRANKQNPLCIDTDPVNRTLAGFSALNAQSLDIMEEDKINARKFDSLIELISSSNEDVIIDNGASSFVPLSSYLVRNQVPWVLSEMKPPRGIIVHTVITGGQALLDTLQGFEQIVTQFPSPCSFVVWLNPYWGKIEYQGKIFNDMRCYVDNKDRIIGMVDIPMLDQDTFGYDFSEMLKAKRTFKETIEDSTLSIMVRQRIKIIQTKIFKELDNMPELLYGD